PVISPDGRLYLVGDTGRLTAFNGLSGPARSAWPMFRRDWNHTARTPQASLSVSRQPPRMLHLVCNVEPGARFSLQTSQDFLNWFPIATNGYSWTTNISDQVSAGF